MPRRLLPLLLLTFLAACQPAPLPPPGQPFASPTASATLPPTPIPTLINLASTRPASPTPAATPSLTPDPSPSPTFSPPPLITLVFSGQIVPARCVQAGVDAAGNADYIFENVRDLLSQGDLTVGTLNASLSDYPPTTGCVSTFVLVGRPESADAMARAGFDVMSVATNHIKNCGLTNCGDRAFLDTLENLRQAGIIPVGAGLNLAEALQPVVVTIQGVRFGIVSLGQIEKNAFAGQDTPGIGILNEENLRSSIAAAREMADVVIVLPHWGPEYSPLPNPSQQHLARAAVEAGADLVVGNHTHVIQSITSIEGVPVFYGLGNFVFDQTWSEETQQAIILRVTFEGSRYLRHEIIPTITDGDGRVRVAGQQEAVDILTRIQQISDN